MNTPVRIHITDFKVQFSVIILKVLAKVYCMKKILKNKDIITSNENTKETKFEF